MRIDDNLLNIKAMFASNLDGVKKKRTYPDPLSDNQIRALKSEIRRVHVKFMKQEEVQEKR